MRFPSVREFVEVRRLFPVLAAIAFVVALALPMWTIEVHAVQYPNTVLHIQLYAYPHIAGDYAEMARLNHYVGFYYPDPVLVEPNYDVQPRAVDVPEWALGPVAFLGCAATGAFVALAPTEAKLKKGLTAQLVGTVGVFAVLVADIQYRLYETGHSLDPDAPVMGVSGFTPPLWGKYEVANITSYSRFGAGAYVAMLAVGLLVVAYRYRDEPTTARGVLRDVAGLVPGRGDGVDDGRALDDGEGEDREHGDRGGNGPVGGD